MRGRIVLVVALGAATALLSACFGEANAEGDVCVRARARFATCGATLPLLSDGPCTGTSKLVSQCVADHASDCDELATLLGRIDECMTDVAQDDDSLLPPATDLPVAPRDGGRDASGDDAAANRDAAPVPSDGGFTTADASTDGGAGAQGRP